MDLPLNKAEMILLRVFVQAYVGTAHLEPHLRGRSYLGRAEMLLRAEANLAAVAQIRPSPEDRELAAERKRAHEIFNLLAPLLVAALPPDLPIRRRAPRK